MVTMETGAGRLPPHVLGENEALQQFFSVLDSSATIDTSILEQYLSNDVDPITFILPESPPDSSSESCSPLQIPDHSCRSAPPAHALSPVPQSRPPSCSFTDGPLSHAPLPHLGLTNTCLSSRTPSATLLQHTHPSPDRCSAPEGYCRGYIPPTPPSPSHHHLITSVTGQGAVPHIPRPSSEGELGLRSGHTSQTSCKANMKRRRSECEEPLSAFDGSPGSSLNLLVSGSSQLLTWEPYLPGQWSSFHDKNHQILPCPAYHVNADKGFSYSPADESFVCQKKNHFQVTVHIGMAAEPQFVSTPQGPQQVDHFQIKVFGIKLETPSYLVTIEQSLPNRSKKPFHPVRVSLPGGKITKVTLGRLHFSETTSNNMRKKGKPNPDQRYFQMVVGLYAVVGEETFLLAALVSERIIVRASNPGQFDLDGDSLWQRGSMPDSVVCPGRVGINTDSPDEALVVCGNAKVMGAIMQPSDGRAKENIQEVDSQQQLKRINQMRIVEFDYKPEFASTMGIDHPHQTGVIAQEVKELLPSAVREVGDVTYSDGETINNFLMVDKEQIFMENVGAVQQLAKLTDNLENRIQELEVWNRRLAKLRSLTGSLRSTGRSQQHSGVPTAASPELHKPGKASEEEQRHKRRHCLRNKIFKVSVFALLSTMAFCIISITTLYLLTVEKDTDFMGGTSNNSLSPVQTTPWSSTDSPFLSSPAPSSTPPRPPGPRPPDVHFCDLLYCDQVYCCPLPAGGATESTGKSSMTETKKEDLNVIMRRARDWTNTTIHTFLIKESQQVIDSRYCMRDKCGPEKYIFRVPVSRFVPVNMRVTLVMNSTELLVVHLCGVDETTTCSSLVDATSVSESRYPSNTQGEHEWPLQVSRLHQSSYHFRATVAGQADCSTDHHYAGALYTDYYFNFYRRCVGVGT